MTKPLLYQVGTKLGDRYELEAVLGQGASGVVYRAVDHEMFGQVVALKVLYPHLVERPEVAARFRNEVRIARDLSHPHIVRIFEWGTAGPERHFLVMEYVTGHGLRTLLDGQPGRRLPIGDATRILYEVADALAAAHARGIVHRDLKPDNLIIDDQGHVKILDFGIARVLDDDKGFTRTGESMGTPYYMAPEQFRGEKADPRSDLYSFGILAFELLTGAPPFQAEVYYQLALQHLNEPLPPFPKELNVPEWLDSTIRAIAAKESDQRQFTASQLADLFASHLEEGTLKGHEELVRTWRATEHQRVVLARRRRTRRAAALGVALTLTGIVGFFIGCRFNSWQWPIAAGWAIRLEHLAGPRVAGPMKWALGIEVSLSDQELFDKLFDQLLLSPPGDTSHYQWKHYSGELIAVLNVLGEPEQRVRTPDGRANPDGRVPLIEAVIRRGPKEALAAMLKRNVDPNYRMGGAEPLINFLIRIHRADISDVPLTDPRFDPSQADTRIDGQGDTAWHAAIRYVSVNVLDDIAKLSLLREKHDWPTNVRNQSGQTPLEMALASMGDVQDQLVTAILFAKPDLLLRNLKDGRLPIEQAVHIGTETTVLRLLNHLAERYPEFRMSPETRRELAERNFNAALYLVNEDGSIRSS